MIDRSYRLAVKAKILVRTGCSQSFSLSSNISQTGVFVETTEEVRIDDAVNLIVYDEAHSRLLNAHARVVRVADGGFGACFVHATPAGRTEVQHFLANL